MCEYDCVIVCVCVKCIYVYVYVCMCHFDVGSCRGQKTALLKPEIQAVVSCLTWLLGTKCRSSGRVARALAVVHQLFWRKFCFTSLNR